VRFRPLFVQLSPLLVEAARAWAEPNEERGKPARERAEADEERGMTAKDIEVAGMGDRQDRLADFA
jgi:hypothetical protein